MVAYPSGALPEVVDHGRTGFIATSVSDMARAIRAVGLLDPVVIRAVAEERFSVDAMVERTLAAYAEVIRANRPEPTPP